MQVDNGTLNYRVYEDAIFYFGMAEVELPEIGAIAEEIKGAGISGAFNGPFMGHVESMSLKLTFRSVTTEVTKLMEPRAHQLTLMASQQRWNSEAGEYETTPVKHVIIGAPLKYSPGKVAPASPTDTSVEFSVSYFASFINGVKVTEVDPINFIYFMNGKDWLAQARRDIGM